jgi:hypothetical protein
LDGEGAEQSSLFKLDLINGDQSFLPLPDYLFGHYIILSRNGHIMLADDGLLDIDHPEALLTKPIKPALYYFTPKLALSKTIPLRFTAAFFISTRIEKE